MGKLLPLYPKQGRPDELSDEALLAACAAGDSAALAALYDRFETDVYRCLMRLTYIDQPVVDDLIQDTFMQVFSSSADFNGDSAVRTWILGITANLARKHARSDARRKQRQQVYFERLDTQPGDPGAAAERRELLERLEDALEELPQRQREAFVLCDVEGIKGVEAARALDIPSGTLYRRLHRARRALREALEGEMP
jgi:RNA polymerase sigma-70 factor (ECF subfamily)